MRNNFTQKNKGAVLLIAVLMASVMLSVGMGVYQRTYKSLVFASFWKQTQVAFAAADAGLECAMYLDLHPTAPQSCFGQASTAWKPASGWVSGGITPPGGVEITVPSGGCVNIVVTKQAVSPMTHIEARGYNTCDTTNVRRVERGLKVDY